MVSLRRELVYSLLIAIGLLVAGLIALLWVADAREQRYQDELSDLRRSLATSNVELRQLRQQLKRAIPATDSAWADWSADSASASFR